MGRRQTTSFDITSLARMFNALVSSGGSYECNEIIPGNVKIAQSVFLQSVGSIRTSNSRGSDAMHVDLRGLLHPMLSNVKRAVQALRFVHSCSIYWPQTLGKDHRGEPTLCHVFDTIFPCHISTSAQHQISNQKQCISDSVPLEHQTSFKKAT